jgi:hypothetical protein
MNELSLREVKLQRSFIAVTPPMAALRFLRIIRAFNAYIYPVYTRIICFGRLCFLESNTSLCSLHQASSIKHQVASVILHVTTGLAPLRRLARGLSPVNKTTTATAVFTRP